jgi:hypothetical protein
MRVWENPIMLPSLTLRVPFAVVRDGPNVTPRVREGSAKRVLEFSHRL